MFKRIIFPTDFSESSAKAFSYALDIAQAHKSEVIILYTYRLISGVAGQPASGKILLKKEQEEIARQEFERLKKCYPELHTIDHNFLTEIGFISDRITLAIERFNTDLVIISESIQQKLKEKWEMNQEDLVSRFHCPVLLVPSEQMTVPVGKTAI